MWLACLLTLSNHNYASPTSGEAYRDRRLTTNFELWVEFFCVPTCFHMRIPKTCLSVCLYPDKRNHHSFVNISPTLVIDTSMERFSRVPTTHGNPKNVIFFKKVRNSYFVLCQKAEIQLDLNMHLMMTSGMHRRPFEGRHLVLILKI